METSIDASKGTGTQLLAHLGHRRGVEGGEVGWGEQSERESERERESEMKQRE